MSQQLSKLLIKGSITKLFQLISCVLLVLIVAATYLIPSQGQTDNYFNVINKAGLLRWKSTAMPLHVYIKQCGTTDGFRPEFVTLLEQAFSEWASGTQNLVRFVSTTDPSKAQIICSWTSDKNDMTKLTEGGHALVIPSGHDIQRVEITILTKTVGGEVLTDPYYKRIALHEIGHACGITDHSPNPEDMMYSNPPCSTTNCVLSERDKNTMIALYQLDQQTMNHKSINMEGMLPDKNNQSNLARIIRLNAEAAKAMQAKNLALAVSKLEEAHKIDPKNELINSNLGSAYGQCAVVASIMRQTNIAQTYFNKALPLLAKGPNRENYLSVLSYYENFLRAGSRTIEAEQIQKKVKELSN